VAPGEEDAEDVEDAEGAEDAPGDRDSAAEPCILSFRILANGDSETFQEQPISILLPPLASDTLMQPLRH
jgi:hypothetical protein